MSEFTIIFLFSWRDWGSPGGGREVVKQLYICYIEDVRLQSNKCKIDFLTLEEKV